MSDHTPKHRATPEPLEIDPVKLGRRGLLGATAAVALTGGAAAAATKHGHRHNAKWVRPRRKHASPKPSPTPTPTASASPTATATATATASPTATPTTSTNPTRTKRIGMSAPATDWDQRISEVGAGVGARRIFADLAQGATSQIKLVEQAHAAGMLPVISYKVGGDIAGAVAGKYNAVAQQAAAKLASYNKPTAVVFWHEPNPDISPDQYVAASKQLLPIFRSAQVKVGPILNGWLLDKQLATFSSYAPSEMFAYWDWFGIDTYESGTAASPGQYKPADRIPKLVDFVSSRGFGGIPLGVGEYNGYSADTIAATGDMLLSTPTVWFGCVWDSTGGKGTILTGDRLDAFRATLADPRLA